MVTKQTETVINHTPDSHLRTGFQNSPEPRSRSMGGKPNVIPSLPVLTSSSEDGNTSSKFRLQWGTRRRHYVTKIYNYPVFSGKPEDGEYVIKVPTMPVFNGVPADGITSQKYKNIRLLRQIRGRHYVIISPTNASLYWQAWRRHIFLLDGTIMVWLQ